MVRRYKSHSKISFLIPGPVAGSPSTQRYDRSDDTPEIAVVRRGRITDLILDYFQNRIIRAVHPATHSVAINRYPVLSHHLRRQCKRLLAA